MLNMLINQNTYYIMLGVFLMVGVVGEFIQWYAMKKLLSAAKSVKETENHNLIKQMKLGYTNAYKLNYSVNNTNAFIEKYLCRYKIGRFSLSFISSIDEKMILMCGICCVFTIMMTLNSGTQAHNIIFSAGFGVMAVFLLRLASAVFAIGEMREQFVVLMVDYFENVLKNRLSNHKKDNKKIVPMEEKLPKAPKTKSDAQTFVKPNVESQTAAAKSSEEAIVEEIIREFFP